MNAEAISRAAAAKHVREPDGRIRPNSRNALGAAAMARQRAIAEIVRAGEDRLAGRGPEVTAGMAGREPQRSSRSDRRRRANNETDSVLKIPSGRPGR